VWSGYVKLRVVIIDRLASLFFFSNLMSKFFILIHLLYSSTCFEHYYAHLQEDNCIKIASGIVTMETSGWSKLLKYSVTQNDGLSFLSLYFRIRTSDKYDVNYIWLLLTMKFEGWRLNVETKTKRTLHSSRRLSFNELTNAKNFVLFSSHFALNWRCCPVVR